MFCQDVLDHDYQPLVLGASADQLRMQNSRPGTTLHKIYQEVRSYLLYPHFFALFFLEECHLLFPEDGWKVAISSEDDGRADKKAAFRSEVMMHANNWRDVYY